MGRQPKAGEEPVKEEKVKKCTRKRSLGVKREKKHEGKLREVIKENAF